MLRYCPLCGAKLMRDGSLSDRAYCWKCGKKMLPDTPTGKEDKAVNWLLMRGTPAKVSK